MSKTQKKDSVLDDPTSKKVQEKFDIVFSEVVNVSSIDEDRTMGSKAQNQAAPIIDLNLSEADEPKKVVSPLEKSHRHELDFTLDFDYAPEIESGPRTSEARGEEVIGEDEGFSLEGIEHVGMELEDSTRKTVVFDATAFAEAKPTEREIDEEGQNTSIDLMTRAEIKANIESTIKDILRPKVDSTQNFDLAELVEGGKNEQVAEGDLEATEVDFVHASNENLLPKESAQMGHTGEFNLTVDELASFAAENEDVLQNMPDNLFFEEENVLQKSAEALKTPVFVESSSVPDAEAFPILGGSLGTEDSLRFQATIRQLRQEREDLLGQLKDLKRDGKELEQDNLSLKANLDEAKIEISILRKRHMVDIEDMKYRLNASEEKKALADERARQADMKREKLEQKVRIDFNQVKQREKELESKLELLSMDVDSQVQGRDLKILELRRKIDALEFNMENTTIKEQKSLEDKRKLEDRLNKMMKTLRNSIKNLEEDVDLVQEDDHNADKN